MPDGNWLDLPYFFKVSGIFTSCVIYFCLRHLATLSDSQDNVNTISLEKVRLRGNPAGSPKWQPWHWLWCWAMASILLGGKLTSRLTSAHFAGEVVTSGGLKQESFSRRTASGLVPAWFAVLGLKSWSRLEALVTLVRYSSVFYAQSEDALELRKNQLLKMEWRFPGGPQDSASANGQVKHNKGLQTLGTIDKNFFPQCRYCSSLFHYSCDRLSRVDKRLNI